MNKFENQIHHGPHSGGGQKGGMEGSSAPPTLHKGGLSCKVSKFNHFRKQGCGSGSSIDSIGFKMDTGEKDFEKFALFHLVDLNQ